MKKQNEAVNGGASAGVVLERIVSYDANAKGYGMSKKLRKRELKKLEKAREIAVDRYNSARVKYGTNHVITKKFARKILDIDEVYAAS